MRLCTLLNIDDLRAVGLLHFLWWWALDNAPDGDLGGLTDKELALACHWKGKPTPLVEALCQAGWLDKDGDYISLHNWQDYAGKLVANRISNKERQREHRERIKSQGTSQLRNNDITVTSPLRHGATVPNSTQQNSTEDDRREEDRSSSADKNDELLNIFELYETNIEVLTDSLKELIAAACEKHTGVWVIDAILVAKEKDAGKRNWEYIAGILRTWEREGHVEGRIPSGTAPPRRDDPDKFVKGKFGNLVQR